LKALNAYLDGRACVNIDLNTFMSVMNYNKELELMNETDIEANEYLDAFVALGGQPDKEGSVSKETLIQIIKLEFELTIDMVVSVLTLLSCV